MALTIYDSLPEAVRGAYPPERLDPRALKLLSIQVPPGYPPERLARLSQMIAPRIPRMTADFQRSRRRTRAQEMADAEATGQISPRPLAEDAYAAAGPVRRTAMRAMDVLGRSISLEREQAPMVVPPARTFPEHATELVAGAAGFMGVAGATTAALAPVLGPLAPVAGLAAAGAAPAGTLKERAIRGGTTAIAGQVGHGLGALAARRMTAQAARAVSHSSTLRGAGFGRLAGQQVQRAVGAGVGARLVPGAASAASFGALQPNLEAAAMKATGEKDVHFLDPREMAQGTANLAALNVAMAALHMVPAFRDAMTRGRVQERPARPRQLSEFNANPQPFPPSPIALPPPRTPTTPLAGSVRPSPVAPAPRGLPAPAPPAPPAPALRPDALERIQAASTEPPLPRGEKQPRGAARAATRKLNEMMAGRQFMLRTPEGEAQVGIAQVFYFPYKGVAQPVRVIAYDPRTGDVDALVFKNLGELRASLVSAETAVPREPQRVSRESIAVTARIRALERNIASHPSSPKMKKWKSKLSALRGMVGAGAPPTPEPIQAVATPVPAAAKKRVSEGVSRAAVIPPAATAAPVPKKAAPVAAGPLHTRASGAQVPIRTMPGPHLVNAEARATGAEREALRAEMKRRGIVLQPWQRVRDDFVRAQLKGRINLNTEGSPDWREEIERDVLARKEIHRASVERALREGKKVPPEVMVDYPDLAPNKPAPPQPSPQQVLAAPKESKPQVRVGKVKTEESAVPAKSSQPAEPNDGWEGRHVYGEGGKASVEDVERSYGPRSVQAKEARAAERKNLLSEKKGASEPTPATRGEAATLGPSEGAPPTTLKVGQRVYPRHGFSGYSEEQGVITSIKGNRVVVKLDSGTEVKDAPRGFETIEERAAEKKRSDEVQREILGDEAPVEATESDVTTPGPRNFKTGEVVRVNGKTGTVVGYQNEGEKKRVIVSFGRGRAPRKGQQVVGRRKSDVVETFDESQVRRRGKADYKSMAEKFPTLFKEYQEKYKDAPIEKLKAVAKRLDDEHWQRRREAQDALYEGTDRRLKRKSYIPDIAERQRESDRITRLAKKAWAAREFVNSMISARGESPAPPTRDAIEANVRAEIDDRFADLVENEPDVAPNRSLFERTVGRVVRIAQEHEAVMLHRSNGGAISQALYDLAPDDPLWNTGMTVPEMIARAREAEYPANEWQKIENDLIDKFGPMTPDEMGGGMSFMGTGEIGRALGRLILGNIPKALDRTARIIGKGMHYTHRDRQGNVVKREKLDEFRHDAYTDFAIMRLGAHMRLLGGDTVLPPQLVGTLRTDTAAADDFAENAAERVLQALGKDGMLWAHRNPVEANRAAEGKPNKAPAWFKQRVVALRAVLDAIHAMHVKRATTLGQEVPGYVENYVMRVVTGMRAGSAAEMIRLLDGEGITPAQIEERTDRLFAHRTGDPHYTEDLLDNLRRYIDYSAYRIGHDRFFREVVEYLSKDPEISQGREKGATSRGDLIMDWMRATYFRKKSNMERDHEAGLRRILFSKTAGSVHEISAAHAEAMSGKSAQEIREMLAKKDPGGPPPDRFVWVEPGGSIAFLKGEPSEAEVANAKLAKAEGREWDQPAAEHAWVEVGTDKDGRRIFAGNRGHARGAAIAEPSPALRQALDFTREFGLAVRSGWSKARGKGWDPETEGMMAVREQRKFLERLHNDPIGTAVSFWTANNLRAVMGYNASSATQNAGNFMLTSMPEYGIIAAMQAVLAGSRAKGLSHLRGIVGLFESRGWLTTKQANAARRHLPVLLEEVLARASASEQGEAHVARANLDDIAAGRDPHLRRAIEATVGPFAMFAYAEGMQRTLDATGAEIMGRRLGLDDKAIEAYVRAVSKGDEKARRKAFVEMMGEVRDFSTRMSLIGTMSDLTQYHYGPRSRMWLFGTGPYSKLFTSLSTWPLNNLFKQVLRPAEGMARTTAAAVRGVAQALTPPGAIKDAPYKPRRGITPRSVYPKAKGWWTKMLEANGANWAHRQGAASFLRHMIFSGLLTGLTRLTNVNFARFGINPLFPLGIFLLTLLFPKDELKKWLKLSQYGSTASFLAPQYRGFVSVGPAIEAGGEVAKQAAKNITAGTTSGDPRKAFPGGPAKAAGGAAIGAGAGWVVGGGYGAAAGGIIGALAGAAAFESSLKQVRRQVLGFLRLGEVELSRIAQEQPEMLKKYPRMADALGIKTTVKAATPSAMLRHQTGLMTEAEKQKATKRVVKSNKPITRARLRQTFQPAY